MKFYLLMIFSCFSFYGFAGEMIDKEGSPTGIDDSSTCLAGLWNPLNWFDDRFPAISRDYTKEDYWQSPDSQQIVLRGDDIIVIDKSCVFRLYSEHNKWEYLHLRKVKSIFDFKGVLMALDKKGAVYLYDHYENVWQVIANKVLKALSTEQNLFFLQDDQQVWVFKGDPKKNGLEYQATVVRKGTLSSAEAIVTPVIGGKTLVLQRLPIWLGIIDIEMDPESKDVLLIYQDSDPITWTEWIKNYDF